ncbi:hypothetical protein PMZ80_002156 [Knufia obscura]|uniref:PNPLA domain-containing protein n=2 Tax=Knufia TaxID=430999 RepID=A0AAN8EXU3_9EURO|nr:hypothetical protein PMZ80_002156 [Knufia obscura]KAK5953968.1 hypothetical protein OHC33_005240 [Knufia fluminis]
MDNHNVRRKDTTKGPPLRVLSLDGGGVRGYSMLIILQELMYRAYVETEGKPPKRDEIPKPCEYFDMIAGTGTGGLIAIMLGRLRLDIETSMDVYVRMTKKVFETDKTIAGIPYKQTLFKASKLEEAIKQCVAEHTVYEDEGNDGTQRGGKPFGSTMYSPTSPVARSMSVRSNNSIVPSSPASTNRTSLYSPGPGFGPSPTIWGNPEASLYDDRENRTKTAVTAVYKGTNPKTGSAILLRSYDSRKEPPPEFNCTIWQAGRATSATGLAFKPIQIGQSVFIDEGAGKYNPSPQILEEAVVNEYPGRDMGVFVSIGTGKRPPGTNSSQSEWWEGFIGGSVGSFAEARRRLIAKIEACEDTHVQMMNQELPKYKVPRENYARLNVEVGVGEFGMNEWDRLSDMTIGTRRYLKKEGTQDIIQNAAYKLAKIHLMHRRMTQHMRPVSWQEPQQNLDAQVNQPQQQNNWPAAVELPADEPTGHNLSPRPPVTQPQIHFRTPSNPPYPDDQSYSSRKSSNEKFAVLDPGTHNVPSRLSHESARYSNTDEKFSITSSDYRTAPNSDAPPRPPKTPINEPQSGMTLGSPLRTSPMYRPAGGNRLPYPVDDEGPPPVNKLRKPQYTPS